MPPPLTSRGIAQENFSILNYRRVPYDSSDTIEYKRGDGEVVRNTFINTTFDYREQLFPSWPPMWEEHTNFKTWGLWGFDMSVLRPAATFDGVVVDYESQVGDGPVELKHLKLPDNTPFFWVYNRKRGGFCLLPQWLDKLGLEQISPDYFFAYDTGSDPFSCHGTSRSTRPLYCAPGIYGRHGAFPRCLETRWDAEGILEECSHESCLLSDPSTNDLYQQMLERLASEEQNDFLMAEAPLEVAEQDKLEREKNAMVGRLIRQNIRRKQLESRPPQLAHPPFHRIERIEPPPFDLARLMGQAWWQNQVPPPQQIAVIGPAALSPADPMIILNFLCWDMY
eukprot:GHVQ01032139.1.p1 GENE.GHVQ01032139.1~~GHVQ01032139.1.p1  ORF type:complete len:338 (+),score=34.96 GHVQ01032139.1:249-1262(+)